MLRLLALPLLLLVAMPARAQTVRGLSVGAGGAVGATVGRGGTSEARPSPALAGEGALGGRLARGWLGLYSTPTFLHFVSYDTATVPLAMVAVGLELGPPTLHAGPYLTAGLLDVGAGVRFAALPWGAHDRGRAQGYELRVTAHPGEGQATLQLMALVAFSWTRDTPLTERR